MKIETKYNIGDEVLNKILEEQINLGIKIWFNYGKDSIKKNYKKRLGIN